MWVKGMSTRTWVEFDLPVHFVTSAGHSFLP